MLFHVERPRIQVEAETQEIVVLVRQSFGHELAHGQHSNLHQNGRDRQRLRPVAEEGVEEDEDGARRDAQEPRPECHHRQ